MSATSSGGAVGAAAAARLRLARELADPACHLLTVPADACVPFWTWYADWSRPDGGVTVATGPPAGVEFPEPTGEIAVWREPDLASAFTAAVVGHLSPTVLRYADVAHEVEPHRGAAPSILARAVLSAQRGASCTYVGVHRRAALAPGRARRCGGADADLEFVERWNDFHPRLRLRTVCADLTYERLLAGLPSGGERELPGCGDGDRRWCGDCAACFDAFHAGRAVDRPLPIVLSGRVADERYGRYRAWLADEFRGTPDAGMEFMAHLQLSYGVRFDQVAPAVGVRTGTVRTQEGSVQ